MVHSKARWQRWQRINPAILVFTWVVGCGLVWRTHSRDVHAVQTASAPASAQPQTPSTPPSVEITAPPSSPAEIATYPVYAAHPEDTAPATPIENADRLDYYFSKLTLTDLHTPAAITRAGHWGDSVLGGDGLTESIRSALQKRFGDAGHGFHIMGKYNRSYHHRGVRYEEVRRWDSCLVIHKCQSDTMRYGYGGVTSTSRGTSLSRFQTMPVEAPPVFGDAVSTFELWYQRRPDGGRFEIRADSQVGTSVESRATAVSDEVETIHVPDGQHSFEVAALGPGQVRAYGVVMERDGPGVVWDELSLIGSFTQRLDYQDAEHFAGQIKRRDLDLIVLMFGGNDLSREKTDLKRHTEPYEREYARVIRKFRAGKPEASCLIMSVTDHAEQVGEAIVSRNIVARLVAAQRRVAEQEQCAFYDTYDAMGGAGTVARWRKAKPALAAADLRHPTLTGQRYIGETFYHALMSAYADFRRRYEGQPLPQVRIEKNTEK